MKIGYRTDFGRGEPWYVAQVPGEGGVDWGYTKEIAKARALNEYWQKRFRADTRYVGHTAHFTNWPAASEQAVAREDKS
jgi:hypothetical protein